MNEGKWPIPPSKIKQQLLFEIIFLLSLSLSLSLSIVLLFFIYFKRFRCGGGGLSSDYVNNNSRWDITIDIMIDVSLTTTYDRVGVGVACRSSTEWIGFCFFATSPISFIIANPKRSKNRKCSCRHNNYKLEQTQTFDPFRFIRWNTHIEHMWTQIQMAVVSFENICRNGSLDNSWSIYSRLLISSSSSNMKREA